MNVPKGATKEAEKQRQVRDKKAECNSQLIVLATSCGTQLKFHKTKRSSYAKKVYVSDDVFFRKRYNQNAILETAIIFECVVRKLWIDARKKANADLIITKDLFESTKQQDGMKDYIKTRVDILSDDKKTIGCNTLWNDTPVINPVSHPFDSKTEDFLKKRKNKNREAAFSSFLSWVLIQQGYQLSCRICSQKTTTKTLNYYIWKTFILPSGKILSDTDLIPITRKCRNYLKSQFKEKNEVILSQQNLVEIGLSPEETNAIDYMHTFVDTSVFSDPTPITTRPEELEIETFHFSDGMLHFLGF